MTISVLVAGQSLALGYGMSPATLPASLAAFDFTGIYISVNGSYWGQLTPGVNTGTPANPLAWGSEVSLAAALRVAHPGEPILIIKWVKGETFLDTEPGFDWSPSSDGELFDSVTATIQSRLIDMGHPLPSALFWDQGQQDATRADTAAAYQSNLSDFLDAAAAQWGGPDIFVAQLNAQSALPYTAAVRAAQQANCDGMTTYLAVTDHLPLAADNIHGSAAYHVGLGNTWASLFEAV